MTARELVEKQVRDSGEQLGRATSGLDPANADFSVSPQARSLRELIVHLSETAVAVETIAGGGKFEWGSYKPQATDWEGLIAEWQGLRSKAIEALARWDDEAITIAADYIVAHDYYHVGQIVATRLAVEPEWNSYVIYG
jgi:hypothetical protein